jgi:hypothetical protein
MNWAARRRGSFGGRIKALYGLPPAEALKGSRTIGPPIAHRPERRTSIPDLRLLLVNDIAIA